jgi:hypothetical protein
MSKDTQIGVTGVDYYYSKVHLLSNNANSKNNNFCNDSIAMQSLEGYVLPLLPSTPLHIHKMQFKLKIRPESYNELALPADDIKITSRTAGTYSNRSDVYLFIYLLPGSLQYSTSCSSNVEVFNFF